MTEHHTSTQENHAGAHHAAGSNEKGIPTWALLIGVILLIGGVYLFVFSPTAAPSPTVPSPSDGSEDSVIGFTGEPSVAPIASNGAPDSTVLSKAKYLKELYTVDRDSYQLFEKAAAYRGETLDETKKFFLNCCDLGSQEEIFAELPLIPSDFSTVAFNFATGQLYQLGSMSESYYKQPELYFHTDQTSLANRKLAFSAWSQPQLNYWGDYGASSTPADQYGVVSKKNNKTFKAAVFVTNGWNIQNWVGMHMVTNLSASQFFDVKISEEKTGQPYFLLGPTFPTFSRDWATKLTIEGTVKDSTPPGVYQVRVNPIQPPKELSQKWSDDHLGIYVPYGGLVPDTGFITLNITVTE